MYQFWEPHDEQKLYTLVKQGEMSYEEIAKKHFPSRTGTSLLKKCRKNNVYNPYLSQLKYGYNQHFWDEPNEINTYWAGFIAADGHIRSRTDHSYILRIELSDKDECVLQQFLKDIGGNQPIKYCYKTTALGRKKRYCYVTISFWEDWFKPLYETYGFTNHKTKTCPAPKIPDEFIFSFIKGYIDGDGCHSVKPFQSRTSIRIYGSSPILYEWMFSHLGGHLYDRKSKSPEFAGARFNLTLEGESYRRNIDKFYAIKRGLPRKWPNRNPTINIHTN